MSRRPPRSAVNRPRPGDDSPRGPRRDGSPPTVRIVGGTHRGRKLVYSGDLRVRPMKDRTREALFNLLGPSIVGTYVLDLFAGTGALALEGISRGAVGAIAIEWYPETAQVIRANANTLGESERVQVISASAFSWGTTHWTAPHVMPSDRPWTVFCCPPYAFYEERSEPLRGLLERIHRAAPPESAIVVEAECPFDFSQLLSTSWRARDYPPAAIGITRISGSEDEASDRVDGD